LFPALAFAESSEIDYETSLNNTEGFIQFTLTLGSQVVFMATCIFGCPLFFMQIFL